jgi:hypothetical protein
MTVAVGIFANSPRTVVFLRRGQASAAMRISVTCVTAVLDYCSRRPPWLHARLNRDTRPVYRSRTDLLHPD